jgi:hypothetical protein
MYILFVFTWIGKEKLSKRLRFLSVSIACTIFFISADNVFLLCLYCNVVHAKQIVKYTHKKKGKNIGIAMPDSSDSYIEPVGQVDFPG